MYNQIKVKNQMNPALPPPISIENFLCMFLVFSRSVTLSLQHGQPASQTVWEASLGMKGREYLYLGHCITDRISLQFYP